MKKTILAVIIIVIPLLTFSQYSLSGKITDAETGDALYGAHIVLKGKSLTTVTDKEGFYRFKSLKAGSYTFEISYVGFKSQILEVELNSNQTRNFQLEPNAYMTDEVLVVATRIAKNTPTTYKNLDKEEIESTNLGQDIPFLLDMMPSTVTTSDAGAGIGYTGIRIRGTDITRINVTVNGIPLNDAESHGVFWVNMPDFSSSIDNIQVQRGVGTSKNGAAAFGASINLQTTTLNAKPYAEINSTIGSYSTFKNNVRFGTGLLNGKFTIDGRLSKITSDGYIDRAFSDLKSFYLSGAFYGKNNIVKLNIFSGKERTYQAWGGVPKDMLETNRRFNPYTYENETDNYQQSHYQLLYTQKLSTEWQFNAALHYTKGAGYYEQFKEGRAFSGYKIDPITIGGETIDEMDLIQQKWLDNNFYGATYSVKYEDEKTNVIVGGAWNKYIGDHFGEVIWSQYAVNIDKNYRWYFNKGHKKDFNLYTKVNYQLSDKVNLYGDIQYRAIRFDIKGIHDDLRNITTDGKFDFFNPKAGVYYTINKNSAAYASFAVSNREPSRNSYRDADADHNPTREKLFDYEFGYSFRNSTYAIELNAYYMDYTDQLVMTGEINNVGSPIMTNVPDSYRLGLEFAGGVQITPDLRWDLTATISKNRIKEFTAYVDNWTGDRVIEQYENTHLSFSPSLITGSTIKYNPVKGFSMALISKYVSRQYIDNTSSKERSLDPYFVSNINLSYTFKTKLIPEVGFKLLVNNIFNEIYETNAWTYRYFNNGTHLTDFGFYPQAETNFLFGVTLKF